MNIPQKSDPMTELAAKIKQADSEVQNFISALKAENLALNKKIAKLQAQNVSLNSRVKALEKLEPQIVISPRREPSPRLD